MRSAFFVCHTTTTDELDNQNTTATYYIFTSSKINFISSSSPQHELITSLRRITSWSINITKMFRQYQQEEDVNTQEKARETGHEKSEDGKVSKV